MKQALINAYYLLAEEAKVVSGEEWQENRQRRRRLQRRAMQEYGLPISALK